MSDDIDIIIILAIILAFLFFIFFISKNIGNFVFKNLISDKAKNRLSNYYKNQFFPTLTKGIFAGLSVGPFYSMPYCIHVLFFEEIPVPDWIEVLMKISFLPVIVTCVSVYCALFGMFFEVLSDLFYSVFKFISSPNLDSKMNTHFISAEQFSAIFVSALFGAMLISSVFPGTNLLVCLILCGFLELCKKLWQAIIGYYVRKSVQQSWQRIQKYDFIIIFSVSIICIILSCIHAQSIDFAMLRANMLHYGPLVFFFSFYDKLLEFPLTRKVIKNVGAFMFEFIKDKIDLSPTPMLPIYIFASSLSFTLTIILTNDIILSLVAIALVILSIKKPKLEWIFPAFGVMIAFFFPTTNPNHEADSTVFILELANSVLYVISMLVINFLKLISVENFDMTIIDNTNRINPKTTLDQHSNVTPHEFVSGEACCQQVHHQQAMVQQDTHQLMQQQDFDSQSIEQNRQELLLQQQTQRQTPRKEPNSPRSHRKWHPSIRYVSKLIKLVHKKHRP